jgi:hypothetical protein
LTIFDTQKLNDQVARALAEANVPSNHDNAFALSATSSGALVGVYSKRFGDTWMLESYFRVDSGRHVEGGVQIKATW